MVVSIAGIVPLLPGLSLLHGIYAILNDQQAVGFAAVLGAFAIGTALAAGVTLGEWSSWKVRRRRLAARRRSRGTRLAEPTRTDPDEARRVPRSSSNSRSDSDRPPQVP
jgi:hypothetical protein